LTKIKNIRGEKDLKMYYSGKRVAMGAPTVKKRAKKSADSNGTTGSGKKRFFKSVRTLLLYLKKFKKSSVI